MNIKGGRYLIITNTIESDHNEKLNKFDNVMVLLEKGYSIDEISKFLSISIGEIELTKEVRRSFQMSKEEVRAINDGWANELKEDGSYDAFYMYEPFSDDYWKEDYKIVFCNTNPYGENVPQDLLAKKEFEETPVLIWEIFENWLNKNERNTTIPRSALFMYCLYHALHGHTFTKDTLEQTFYAKENLPDVDSTLKRMTYMNLRNEIGNTQITEDEKKEINRYFFKDDWNTKNFKDLVAALDPDIFIITGEFGLEVLNTIYKNEINLNKQSTFKLGKTLFVHLYHPSPVSGKFSNEYIFERVKNICVELDK
jgi:hypothetical protein